MRIVLGVMLSVLMLGARAEARPRYELRVKRITGSQSIYTNVQYDLFLVDSVRRRVLWKRRVQGYGTKWLPDKVADWSPDRRALAVSVYDGRVRVLVWREGFQLLVPYGYDYTMGCAWSPDNRRLLMRVGASAATDTDTGALYCLKLGRWPRYKYFDVGEGGIRKFAWKSRKTVIYWAVDDNYKIKKPRLWRAP